MANPRRARRGRVKSMRKRIEFEMVVRQQNDKFIQEAEKKKESKNVSQDF